MKKQLEKMVGQVIALYTDKGIEVGVLEKVTSEGVTLRKLAKKDAKDLVNAENVFWGGGFFPFRRFGGFGPGFGGFGPGFGPGFGFGGAGVGFGAGFGFRRGFFW